LSVQSGQRPALESIGIPKNLSQIDMLEVAMREKQVERLIDRAKLDRIASEMGRFDLPPEVVALRSTNPELAFNMERSFILERVPSSLLIKYFTETEVQWAYRISQRKIEVEQAQIHLRKSIEGRMENSDLRNLGVRKGASQDALLKAYESQRDQLLAKVVAEKKGVLGRLINRDEVANAIELKDLSREQRIYFASHKFTPEELMNMASISKAKVEAISIEDVRAGLKTTPYESLYDPYMGSLYADLTRLKDSYRRLAGEEAPVVQSLGNGKPAMDSAVKPGEVFRSASDSIVLSQPLTQSVSGQAPSDGLLRRGHQDQLQQRIEMYRNHRDLLPGRAREALERERALPAEFIREIQIRIEAMPKSERMSTIQEHLGRQEIFELLKVEDFVNLLEQNQMRRLYAHLKNLSPSELNLSPSHMAYMDKTLRELSKDEFRNLMEFVDVGWNGIFHQAIRRLNLNEIAEVDLQRLAERSLILKAQREQKIEALKAQITP